MAEASYQAVEQRLSSIDADLAANQPNLMGEAKAYFKAKRDFEHDFAVEYLKQTGTIEERRNKTIVALWNSEKYKALISAEGKWEGLKAVTRTLETRASIGQSLLRAMQREVGG